MGFSASSRLHRAKILGSSEDLPMIIEIVDIEEKIQFSLPELEKIVLEGLITLEAAKIIGYRANPKDAHS